MFQDLDWLGHRFHIVDYQQTNFLFGSLKVASKISLLRIATLLSHLINFDYSCSRCF